MYHDEDARNVLDIPMKKIIEESFFKTGEDFYKAKLKKIKPPVIEHRLFSLNDVVMIEVNGPSIGVVRKEGQVIYYQPFYDSYENAAYASVEPSLFTFEVWETPQGKKLRIISLFGSLE